MKIIFVASIHGKEKYVQAYEAILNSLKRSGNLVIHEHVSNRTLDDLRDMSKDQSFKFHKDIVKQMKSCDIVFSECSYQSLSVGYLLSFAIIELGIPAVIFHKKNASPLTIFPTLIETGKVFLVEYDSASDIPGLVGDYLEYAKQNMDTRFNFFVSPNIERYLNWITKHKKIPRSVFLRGLIETSMKINREYSGK